MSKNENIIREDDYEILEKLGEGAYGAVFLGKHKKSGLEVAIKQVVVEEESDLEDIVREVDIMKTLESDYIVRYHGHYMKRGKDADELWIVMEYCGAGSIADMIQICDHGLTEKQLAVVCKYVLKGLEYLHKMRKVHRDIKSGNILLNDKGEAKLADFGVSGRITDTLRKRNTVIGTPFWMAPEVIQEVGYTFNVDIWSLGITCIECLETRPPYSNIHPMRAIFLIPSKPPPRLTAPDDWSEACNDFVARCLTKDPSKRPSAADLLKHEFITAAEGLEVLEPLIRETNFRIQVAGSREEALGYTDSETSSSGLSSEEDDGEGSRVLAKGARYSSDDSVSSDDDCGSGYGTTVFRNSTGDVVANDQGTLSKSDSHVSNSKNENNSRPAFLQNMLNLEAMKDKFEKMSTQDLENEIKKIEKDLAEEVKAIQAKYEARKAMYQ